jgi:mRNA interferase MazF
VLVVSSTSFNAWPVRLVVVVPITTRDRGFSHHVPVEGGGLERASFAMPEYVRSIAQHRLRRRLGVSGHSTVGQVSAWLGRIAAL